MPRAERLLSLSDALRGSDSRTIDDLARELGVSARTVHRDLATLRERGLPITGEAGPGGGVRLEGGRGVTAVHLSIAEVVTLWLSARLSRAASDLPWGGAASSALNKLLASLPRARQSELRALCRRVIVGPPASPQLTAAAGRGVPELLGLVEQAITAGIGLRFAYVDRNGQRSTQRTVELHGLLVQTPIWYLITRDVDKAEPRVFRMDRVSSPRLLPELRFRPDSKVIWAALPERVAWRPLA
ncbi:MAG TPA: WYL domain-containing protein [Polyangiales bacterium]|nr:WYL domain-containing protein [Polyangiales bacterium]